jgi:hypothetical protein
MFGDAELILDCRAAKGAPAGHCPSVWLGTPDGLKLELKLKGCQADYQRFMIRVKGRNVSVESYGKEIQHAELPKDTPVRYTLGVSGDAGAEFMNFYARDL